MGELGIFAIRIKQIRETKQMTQKEFSEHIGIKQQTLSGYERGIMKPPLDIAKIIAEKCNVSLDWLCGLIDKMNYDEEIKTYADMFKLLIKLCEVSQGEWSISYEDNKDKFDLSRTFPNIAKLTSTDPYVAEFFKDWEQMYKLYNNNTINQHLYNLWLSDRLKYYKEFSLDDELPFRVDPMLQGEQ